MNKSHPLHIAFEEVAQQQKRLITTIFPSKENVDVTDFDPRGLAIYRNNLLATAQQALAISFPTVLTLIGEKLFNYSCRELLICSPPHLGDWALWGDNYPILLSDLTQLSNYPFVADIAQVDWLRQQSMRAKDSLIEQASLQLLATHDLDDIYVELTPSQFIMNSNYPVIEFWLSHQQPIVCDTTEQLNKELITQSLDKLAQHDFSQKVLIYRPYFNAEIRELSAGEYCWLTSIKQGLSIGKALDMMTIDNNSEDEFSFAQWIGQALEEKLISRLTL